jgi:hypothetical protein
VTVEKEVGAGMVGEEEAMGLTRLGRWKAKVRGEEDSH